MLTQYREKLHLKDVVNHRQKKTTSNFSGLQSVGILMNATDKQMTEIALNYIKKLGRKAGNISILGYVDAKELVGEFSFKRFCKKDLDWLWRPKGEIANQFKQKKYDLLINLAQTDCFPLEYLAVSIDANYKIGALTDYPNNYDLMLEAKSLKKYLEQVNFFIDKFSNN